MTDTCGLTSLKQLATYDPDLSSWRTSEGMSPSDLKKFSRTLPASGMTRSGVLYELPTLAHRTSGQEYSSLPTPTARDYKDETLPKIRYRDGVRQWDTLSRVVTVLLPTPTVVDMGNNKTPPEWEAWLQAMKTKHGNGNGHGKSLTQELIGVDTSQQSSGGRQ